MPARAFAACWLLLLTALVPEQGLAQEDDEDSPFRAGLIAEYRQGERAFSRIETAPALSSGVVSDVRLVPGKLEVTWRGRLLTQGADDYRLHVFAAGEVQIQLGEQTVIEAKSDAPQWHSSEALKLEHDYHPLVIKFVGAGEDERLRLFWSSASFALEPIPAKQLLHDVDQAKRADQPFERGQQVARALRCAACHNVPGEAEPLSSPALDKLSGNINAAWLVDWLQDGHEAAGKLPADEAQDLTAFLLQKPEAARPSDVTGDPQPGARLFNTLGCLACHQRGEQGTAGQFAGGDLSHIAEKRTAGFFHRWLTSPSEMNREHRMPAYDLSASELRNLSIYLASLKRDDRPASAKSTRAPDVARGKQLFAERECASCHRSPSGVAAHREMRLGLPATANCKQIALPRDFAKTDRQALEHFLTEAAALKLAPSRPLDAGQILAERNCLNCHAREGAEGLAPKLIALAKADADLAPLVPALTPPSLLAVGDKLHDTVLLAMIKRMEQPHRDYLQVRMPKYEFSQDELEALLAYFVSYDRIPPNPPDERARPPQDLPKENELAEAGKKLVVAGSGFGCTSCHAIGKFLPSKAPINARGPNISNVGFRLREPYFYRWCKNPARIVPGQEMPSVSVPAKGILKENLAHQLAAVWTILNTPGFEPKDAGPLRIVRYSGVYQPGGPAEFSLDMVRSDGRLYVRPLIINLPNRHNLLYHFRNGRLERWWTGDSIAQLTEGKTWYWQTLGDDLLRSAESEAEVQLVREGESPMPRRSQSQYASLQRVYYKNPGLWMSYTLHFRDVVPERRDIDVPVYQTFTIAKPEETWRNGWLRELNILDVPAGAQAQLRVVSSERMNGARTADNNQTLILPGEPTLTLRIVQEKDDGRELKFSPEGTILIPRVPRTNSSRITIAYETSQPPAIEGDKRTYRGDLSSPGESAAEAVRFGRPITVARRASLAVVPGLQATRLPLDERMMPTAMTWLRRGLEREPHLFVASLEGRIWKVHDEEHRGDPFSPVLPTPYGLVARSESGGYVDVVTKRGLIRLHGNDSVYPEAVSLLADGWGFTDDYHDWAVGLVEQNGHYVIALPCQQDKRSEEDARLRGTVLSIEGATADYPGANFDDPTTSLEPISAGHRFPMGIARNRAGDVFVTDNQGNYNPFNELNHVQKGKHFGFINAIDKNKPKPPTTPPAINIPHPWTRSVNGICFLETPDDLLPRFEKQGDQVDPFAPGVKKPVPKSGKLWGAFEGHLIGCEYDTRRLVRMSLQKVGDTYQGACYPFSLDQPKGENFLGPISCAISPRGELYVGSIRDSGWGGGANVGEIVRIEPPRDQPLPHGIAEVLATKTGFTIRFTQPVDAALAGDAKNYSIESFTRESTPAYGGPDKNRRAEKIAAIRVAPDRLSATLDLPEMRTGYVYEFHLRPLHAGDFFPAEAYYTLNFLPE